MTTPPLETWLPVLPSTQLAVLSCDWHEILGKKIVPKYAGQVFYFADLGEYWLYLGEQEQPPENEQFNWGAIFVLLISLVMFVCEAWLVIHLLKKVGVL